MLLHYQVQMQVPAGVQDYCTTYADCKAKYPDAMSKWDAFFQVLKHRYTLVHIHTVSIHIILSRNFKGELNLYYFALSRKHYILKSRGHVPL